jgi:octaprenyl-diphosphate synthase
MEAPHGVTFQEVLGRFAPDLAEIETAIREQLSSRNELLESMAAHVAFSGGKRLRPLLVVLCSRLSGYEGRQHIGLGNVVEFLHAATLLHDDVLDNAPVRRGVPSANRVWGNHLAVLGGDFLYTTAFDILLQSFPREIIRILCRSSLDMIEGEVLQRQWRGRPEIAEDTYLRILECKTASLIAACCRTGALLAGVGGDQAATLAEFGRSLGIAFQIMDDTLDYLADPAKLGKALGGDLRQGTITLPLIHLFRREGIGAEQAWIRDAIEQNTIDGKAVAAISRLLVEHRCGESALATARGYVERCHRQLERLGASPLQAALLAASSYVITREL